MAHFTSMDAIIKYTLQIKGKLYGKNKKSYIIIQHIYTL